MKLTRSEIKSFLDEKADMYNCPAFIESDPISIPHRFSKREDREISGFLSATIAWGNRKMILRNAGRIIELLDGDPHAFVTEHTVSDLRKIKGFVHRTFNNEDLVCFIKALRYIYSEHGGLEGIFTEKQQPGTLQPAIHELKKIFLTVPHKLRTERHLADPLKGSAAKRINMFLRWMVRSDNRGVDFGIWKSIPMSSLSCPLDVHSGNIARALGILKRKQNDAKAVAELDAFLRNLDSEDPARYDFALFGLGVNEKF